VAFACVSLLALPARAHPAGVASINRSIDFTYVGGGLFRVAYALDFAEGPAYAELEALDADHDGAVTADEQRRYLDTRVPPLVAAWVVEVNGARLAPRVVASHLDVLPGQGGQETLRIDCEVSALVPPSSRGGELSLHVRDGSFADAPGWRTIFARREGGSWSGEQGGGDASLAALRVSDARFVIPTPDEERARSRAAGWLKALLALLALAAAIGVAFALRRRAATR
jgi:hypothetical protein